MIHGIANAPARKSSGSWFGSTRRAMMYRTRKKTTAASILRSLAVPLQ